MEFIDSCVEIKIKRFRKINSAALFSKSYTVNFIKEYEVKVFFHSLFFVEFRRYSQFSEFKEKVRNN